MRRPHFLLGVTYLISILIVIVNCQYGQRLEQTPVDDYYGGSGGSAYDVGGYNPEPEVDDRPKINLGIRLKIPAIKFELPRFNMPKITVSAKIRQPDRPRVISLPEINLDTHSSSAANNAIGTGRTAGISYPKSSASYSGSGAYKPKAIQKHPEQEQTLTFSTHTETNLKPEDEHHEHHEQIPQENYRKKSSYGSYNNPGYHLRTNSWSHPQQQIISQFSVPAYASSNQLNHLTTGSSSSDLGFEAPIYVKPKDSGQPIEAYGRRPVRVMSYPSNSDLFRDQGLLGAQDVFVDSRSLMNGYLV